MYYYCTDLPKFRKRPLKFGNGESELLLPPAPME